MLLGKEKPSVEEKKLLNFDREINNTQTLTFPTLYPLNLTL
jgi:hypothetical protein